MALDFSYLSLETFPGRMDECPRIAAGTMNQGITLAQSFEEKIA